MQHPRESNFNLKKKEQKQKNIEKRNIISHSLYALNGEPLISLTRM